MKKSLMESKIERIISSKKDNDDLRNYQNAIDRFDNLIERGVAKPRGNNSLSLDYIEYTSFKGIQNKFRIN